MKHEGADEHLLHQPLFAPPNTELPRTQGPSHKGSAARKNGGNAVAAIRNINQTTQRNAVGLDAIRSIN